MKVAVVTGASRGIGKAIAEALADERYTLALGARSVETLREIAETLPTDVFYDYLDVSDAESVVRFAERVLDRFGGVDLVVANAGVGYFGRLDEIQEKDFEAMVQVNLLGLWRTVKAFLPSLKRRRGQVVAVTSDVSARVFPGGGAYTSTKWGARALLRVFQMENPEVRFLELRPGATDTYFAGSKPGKPREQGFLKPEEIARALICLLKLPEDVRVEELMLRSVYQEPKF
ncbi:SDR family oxidoreductase [Thermococcus thioreducens]|uniref:Alcohol dehydrogenase n=1 Tax=Thermococcus thioreducens TaxID=277988 RepID=A0A0Q2QQ21_9EURY|nr:SDR family oxidoreductase [Thermococcus thioreducens]ASJ12680.1 alcohol dehydrogenase [Thermococcus thioreducens]KQH82013.1 alcohol dehydrogenase [Thermococcus thioreducens]SEV86817.1 NADP-dependent 3-hydroxy acid dehydrogenase YdfG [Thermococcus thioreducens]